MCVVSISNETLEAEFVTVCPDVMDGQKTGDVLLGFFREERTHVGPLVADLALGSDATGTAVISGGSERPLPYLGIVALEDPDGDVAGADRVRPVVLHQVDDHSETAAGIRHNLPHTKGAGGGKGFVCAARFHEAEFSEFLWHAVPSEEVLQIGFPLRITLEHLLGIGPLLVGVVAYPFGDVIVNVLQIDRGVKRHVYRHAFLGQEV